MFPLYGGERGYLGLKTIDVKDYVVKTSMHYIVSFIPL